MKFFTRFFDMVTDFVYIGTAEVTTKRKFKLFVQYVYIGIKSLFFGRFLKSEKILGRRVYGSSYNYIYGLYKEIVFRNIYYFKPKNTKPIIVDAGANIGMATLYFMDLYPAAKIYCFEPDDQTYNILEKNTKHLTNVTKLNYGLSNNEGKVKFYYNKSIEGDINASVFDRNLSFVSDIKTIQTMKLSNFIKNILHGHEIDLLKMDIEGSEHDVLQDLIETNTLSKINEIILEYHHYLLETDVSRLGSFLSILEKNNYDIFLSSVNFRLDRLKRSQNVFISAKKQK